MTSDTRRFWLCLGLSLLLNALALILVGRFSTSLQLPVPDPTPRLILVTVRPLPKPPKPRIHQVAKRRPGARVHSHSPAPLARQASRHPGGARSRSPLPVLAARPATAAPMPTVTRIHRAILAAHRLLMPALKIPALIMPSIVMPPDPAPISGANAGVGSGSQGVGKSGNGEGSGAGNGAGEGVGQPPGEPFGVGAGTEGDGGPRHVVYVLDISGSMSSRIDRATSELKKALAGLQPDESFNIIAFSDHNQQFDSGLAPATPAIIRRADGFLSVLQIGGGTDLDGALSLALSLPDVNTVIVLTDGVPTVGETNFKRVARHVREMNMSHARISTVGLVGKNPDGTDDSFDASTLLQQIARESGGDSKLVPLGVATPE